jgi:hypothetical protein
LVAAAVSSKAMAKKDEIADLVAKLNEGQFRSFDDLARLVQHGRHTHTHSLSRPAPLPPFPHPFNPLTRTTAVRVQNEVGNIELIKVARWPLDLLNSLKEVVAIIHGIRSAQSSL